MKDSKRDWNKYLNRQWYFECQLVSAINSRYFYFGKTIKPKSKRYEKLVDECQAREDGAIDIWKIYKKFGLRLKRKKRFPIELAGKKPIEIGVYIPWKGEKIFHSSLIVDMDRKKNMVRVTNYRKGDGWQPLKEFLKYVPKKQKGTPKYSRNYYYIVEKRHNEIRR